MNEHRIDDILDRVCRLSGGAKEGADRPTPETIFAHEPELLKDPHWARQIILEDFEARAALGESPSVASYLDRFEELVPDLKPMLELNAALNRLPVSELRDVPWLTASASDSSETSRNPHISGKELGSDGFEEGDGFGWGDFDDEYEPYVLKAKLGEGACGSVFRAWDPIGDREIAVKTLRADKLHSAQRRKLFLAEIRNSMKLRHNNIVTVLVAGVWHGVPFFAMDLIEGPTLSLYQKQLKGKYLQIAKIMSQLAKAVAFAHEKEIIHRDLKPDNILIRNEDGQAVITDFSLAVLQADQNATWAGTRAYMAPEVWQRQAIAEPAADVWSLGILFYELLTGELPFPQKSAAELEKAVSSGKFVRPRSVDSTIPDGLEALCRDCLEADPQRRCTALRLAENLDAYLRGHALDSPHLSWRQKLPGRLRQHRGAVISIVSATAVLVLFAIGIFFYAAKVRQSADEVFAEKGRLAQARKNRADSLFDIGETQQAISEAERAGSVWQDMLATRPDSKEVLTHLADNAFGIGNWHSDSKDREATWKQMEQSQKYAAQLQRVSGPSDDLPRLMTAKALLHQAVYYVDERNWEKAHGLVDSAKQILAGCSDTAERRFWDAVSWDRTATIYLLEGDDVKATQFTKESDQKFAALNLTDPGKKIGWHVGQLNFARMLLKHGDIVQAEHVLSTIHEKCMADYQAAPNRLELLPNLVFSLELLMEVAQRQGNLQAYDHWASLQRIYHDQFAARMRHSVNRLLDWAERCARLGDAELLHGKTFRAKMMFEEADRLFTKAAKDRATLWESPGFVVNWADNLQAHQVALIVEGRHEAAEALGANALSRLEKMAAETPMAEIDRSIGQAYLLAGWSNWRQGQRDEADRKLAKAADAFAKAKRDKAPTMSPMTTVMARSLWTETSMIRVRIARNDRRFADAAIIEEELKKSDPNRLVTAGLMELNAALVSGMGKVVFDLQGEAYWHDLPYFGLVQRGRISLEKELTAQRQFANTLKERFDAAEPRINLGLHSMGIQAALIADRLAGLLVLEGNKKQAVEARFEAVQMWRELHQEHPRDAGIAVKFVVSLQAYLALRAGEQDEVLDALQREKAVVAQRMEGLLARLEGNVPATTRFQADWRIERAKAFCLLAPMMAEEKKRETFRQAALRELNALSDGGWFAIPLYGHWLGDHRFQILRGDPDFDRMAQQARKALSVAP